MLSQAVDPADALFQHGRVPGLVHADNGRGGLQIQAHPAGVGGQKQPAGRVFLEAADEVFAFLAGHAAVEKDVRPFAPLEAADHDFVHAQPLAENDDLGLFILEDFLQ